MCVPASLRTNPLIGLGCLSLAASLACFGLLALSTSIEQASSPGEKDFGVAALAMLFGTPMLVFGLAGILFLFAGMGLWAYRSYVRRV